MKSGFQTAILNVGAICAVSFGAAVPALAQGWSPAVGTMSTARDAHSAITVGSKILVIGGRVSSGGTTTTSVNYYDPATGKFSATGSMRSSRSFFPAVVLNDGRVLAPGGYQQSFGGGTIRNCEIFSPSNGKWATTGSLNTAREQFTGTKLPNGSVLAVGGFSNNLRLNTAEIFNPSTGTWTKTGSMKLSRFGHSATLLTSGPNAGKVFVIGGRGENDVSRATTELFDPATGLWSDGPSMSFARYRHTAAVLADGRILITGGYDNDPGITTCLDTAEVYDPATNVFTMVTHDVTTTDEFGVTTTTIVTSTMSDVRMDHTATLLSDGRVLIVGGWSSVKGSTVASADIFDPATNQFTQLTTPFVSRHEQSAILLPTGNVLLTGGLRWEPSIHQTLNEAWLYTP